MTTADCSPPPRDAQNAASPEERDLLSTLRNGAWLDAQTFPPLAWAVHGLIPEGFGLFTGPPKAGKSWAALGIGLAVSEGSTALETIPTGPARPVLLLALEDGDRRLQGRCRHLLGHGHPIPHRLDYATDTAPSQVLPVIRAWLAEHGRTRPLVILDTLGKVMPPAMPGEGAYQRDYRIGSHLKRLVDDHPGSCLLVVHHVNKRGGEGDWMDSTSGTNGLNGAADWTLNLSRNRNEDAGLIRVTGRDVPEGEYAVTCHDGRWALDGSTLEDAAREASTRRLSANVGDESARVLAYVNAQAGPVTPKQVADALSLSEARQYLKRLADSDRLVKVGRGSYGPVSQPSQVSQTMMLTPEAKTDVTDVTVVTPTCEECGEPMTPTGDHATTHPTCG